MYCNQAEIQADGKYLSDLSAHSPPFTMPDCCLLLSSHLTLIFSLRCTCFTLFSINLLITFMYPRVPSSPTRSFLAASNPS